MVIQAQEIAGLGRHVSGPKSDAGKRTVALPKIAMEALEWHLDRFTGPERDAVVFIAPRGGPVRRARFSSAWRTAKARAGIDADLDPDDPAGLHPHDLRHHALTLTARKPGVTTKEVMARGGHSSPRAALRYQHAACERDHEVADLMDDYITAANTQRKDANIVALPHH